MTLHLGECVLGVFAFDDGGELVASERFPDDPAQIASRLATVETGVPTDEHRALVKKLLKIGRSFTLESPKLAKALSSEFKEAEFKHKLPNRAGSILRQKLGDIAEGLGVPDVNQLKREVSFILTRLKLKHEALQRDQLVVHAIGMLDELDRFVNILTVRLREWYSRHFPELDRAIPSHELYLKLVSELGHRDNFSEGVVKAVGDLPKDEAKHIAEAAETSIGAPFDELDILVVKRCVDQIRSLQHLREQIAEYVEGLMSQIAPNLKALVGGTIGARLISLAGGLSSLSRFPASTIQVLGAEKALFRSFKTKAKPPKHGVIYQHPSIRTAPKRYRGKIARALAGKIAIAARVDSMAGEYVGEKLASEFRIRVSEILRH